MENNIYVDCHGTTSLGNSRDKNEDSFLVAGLNKAMHVVQTSLPIEDQTLLTSGAQGQVFVVADGMGGHEAGDRASSLAVTTLTSYLLNTMTWLFSLTEKYEDDFEDQLHDAMERCRAALEADAAKNPDRRSMGTTLTMAYLLWPRLNIVHAGDSRCYLLRNEEIHQLTKDHTVAERLYAEGTMELKQAKRSHLADVIWNVVSADKGTELSPEVYKLKLLEGDVLLLCTDGLTKHLNNREIADILIEEESAELSSKRLVNAANDAGGSDNTTVIVVRFYADA